MLLAPLPGLGGADLGGIVVRFEGEHGAARVSAEPVAPFQLRLAVQPEGVTTPLVVRVELPTTGPRVWPFADVEVRDDEGGAIRVRRSGTEWFKLLIPVPAVARGYFVQAAPPAGGKPTLPPEAGRVLVDAPSGLRFAVARWHDGHRAALSLRFDDTHPTHLSKVLPALREHGLRGTFMINPGASEPGSRRRSYYELHAAEWAACARQGDQEFANHSAHHRGARSDAEMEAEIGTAARAIRDLTPGRSRLLALNLGGGTHWETTRTLRYYLDKYDLFDASGNSTGMDDSYGDRVANFRRMLAQHLARGLWFRVHYHAIGEGLASSEANFRAVLDIAREHRRDVWIAGMADIHKYQTARSASTLRLRHSDARHVTIELNCQTDPALYDQPLTIEITPPPARAAIKLKVTDAAGQPVALRDAPRDGAFAWRFDVPPRPATYAIEVVP